MQLSDSAGRNAEGKALWHRRDLLELPDLEEQDRLVLPTGAAYCSYRGEVDPGLAAIAKWEDGPTLREVRWAWIVNEKTEKFDRVDARDVTCDHPGYGYSG